MRGIYIRTDPNGMSYVGLSCDIERRWKEEDREALHPTKTHTNDLYFGLKYYGPKKFKNVVLEEVQYDETKSISENAEIISDREKYWIREKNTLYSGYNKTIGGSGANLTQLQQKEIFKNREEEIFKDIDGGITEDLFIKKYKLNKSYYEILRSHSDAKANRFKYKDKNNQLNKGEQIWYNKKKKRIKKCSQVKDCQIGLIQWVEFDKGEYELSRNSGGKAKKKKLIGFNSGKGLMIENKIYDESGHYNYVNSRGLIIRKKIAYENRPDWATEYMFVQLEKYFLKHKN